MTGNNWKLIIGIAGEIASGKDTVAHYFEKKHRASIYRYSDILRDILRRLHLEENRRNLAAISLMLRQSFGEDVFSRAIAEDVKRDPSELVIVDGVRRETDIKDIRILGDFRLLYITADPEKRFARLSVRNQNADDRTKTFEEFKEDSELESEKRILALREKADGTISNNRTLEDLYRQADLFLEKMRKACELEHKERS